MSEKQDQQDRADFGRVDKITDLDADAESNATQQKHMRAEIADSDDKGYFEKHAPQIASGLNITGSKDKNSVVNDRLIGPGDLQVYQAGYNSYLVPFRETLRGEGRLKDLSTAGATLSPEELAQKNPTAAAKLAQRPASGSLAEGAFDEWGGVEAHSVTNIRQFGGLQHNMFSAIKLMDRIKDKLAAKRVQARKESAQSDLNKINEAAQTLADITTVTVAAASWMTEVDALLAEGGAFNEYAEGVGDISDVHQSNLPDWQHGTVDDPTGASLKVGNSKQQKLGNAYDTASTYGGQAVRIAGHVKHAIEAGGGNLDLSLKNIFIVAMGKGGEYERLTAQIDALNKNLADLELSQEAGEIQSVKANLTGTSMQYDASKTATGMYRVDARRRAQHFAGAMGAGSDGTMAMYVAEAYQDLAAWGRLADTQRRELVDPNWRKLHWRLNNVDRGRWEHGANEGDYHALMNNLAEVGHQRDHLNQNLPEWERMASSWNHFFPKKPLIPGSK